MKKFLAILLAVTMLVAVLPTAALAEDKTVYISRTGDGTINLREGPGYDYEVTGNYVHHNNKVTVKDTDGKWSKVKVKATGKTGWIRTYYIDGTTKKLGTGIHVIKSASKVYSKAKSSSSKVGSVSTSDTVKVYYTERDYAKVTVTGSSTKGWIPMSCIGDATSTTPETPSGSAKTVYRVKTNGSNLNVRTGAGTGYGIVTSLPNGAAFTVLATSGNWYKIKTLKTGITGWVSKTWTAKHATGRVSTSGGHLNVRKGPSTSKPVLDSLPNGAKVTVKNVQGNWVYLTRGSLKGWSSLTYIKF